MQVSASGTDEHGNTFLHIAAINNQPQVIEEFYKLVSRGNEIQTVYVSIMWLGIWKCHASVFENYKIEYLKIIW